MNAYVTRKEYLCLFKNAQRKQRSACIIKRRDCKEDRKTSEDTLDFIIEAFNGEVVSLKEENLFVL